MHRLANSTGINLSDRARITRPLVRLATVAHPLVRATLALVPTLGGCGAKMCRDESRHGTHEYVRDTCCEVILAQTLSPNTFLRPPGLPSLHLCSIPRPVRASRAQRYARPSRS